MGSGTFFAQQAAATADQVAQQQAVAADASAHTEGGQVAAADAPTYTDKRHAAASEQQGKTLSAQRQCVLPSSPLQPLLDVRASAAAHTVGHHPFTISGQDTAGMHFPSQAQKSAQLQSEHGLEMHCPSFKPAGQLDRSHTPHAPCAPDFLEHTAAAAGNADKKDTSQSAIATPKLASTSTEMTVEALLPVGQGTHASVGDGFAWQFDQSTGKVVVEFDCAMMRQNGAQIQSTFDHAAEAVKGLQAMLTVSRAPLLSLTKAASTVEV